MARIPKHLERDFTCSILVLICSICLYNILWFYFGGEKTSQNRRRPSEPWGSYHPDRHRTQKAKHHLTPRRRSRWYTWSQETLVMFKQCPFLGSIRYLWQWMMILLVKAGSSNIAILVYWLLQVIGQTQSIDVLVVGSSHDQESTQAK